MPQSNISIFMLKQAIITKIALYNIAVSISSGDYCWFFDKTSSKEAFDDAFDRLYHTCDRLLVSTLGYHDDMLNKTYKITGDMLNAIDSN